MRNVMCAAIVYFGLVFGAGFVLLMVEEFALSVWGFGRPAATYLAQYRSGTAQLGLAAQLVFAALPLIRR